jgi:tryptophan halogenase
MTAASGAGAGPIRRIVIVGGGTAGWMSAAVLARALSGSGCSIVLVESPDIGTVGVGEATIPPILDLLQFLSIDAADFIHHTRATFKLGIRFSGWRAIGQEYWHPFGTFGEPINSRPFYHAWNFARAQGLNLRHADFSLNAKLGDAGNFRFPAAEGDGPEQGLRYALHFDAALVAGYLRAYAKRLGVRCLGRTVDAATRRADGGIDELVFSSGDRLAADLYIDCSGFRALLIERTLQTGFENWSRWLPCDRAIAVQTEAKAERPPYTQATAGGAGWRWRIPLQHRVGNGHVYCSAHLSDEQALQELTTSLRGAMLTEPRVQRFIAGSRRLAWHHNCVAIGLSSGFLEPLESTSIHLIMSGLYRLLEFFPDASFAPAGIASYNRESMQEMQHIRDFIVLHYCLTERQDTPFWRECRDVRLPDSLQERIELYSQTGRVRTGARELFTDLSWFHVFEGMGVLPWSQDPLLQGLPADRLRAICGELAARVDRAARESASHDSFFANPAAQPAGVAAPGPAPAPRQP